MRNKKSITKNELAIKIQAARRFWGDNTVQVRRDVKKLREMTKKELIVKYLSLLNSNDREPTAAECIARKECAARKEQIVISRMCDAMDKLKSQLSVEGLSIYDL